MSKLNRSHEKWSSMEEYELKGLFFQGTQITDIAERLGRSEGAIESRLIKLKLLTPDSNQRVEDEKTGLLHPANSNQHVKRGKLTDQTKKSSRDSHTNPKNSSRKPDPIRALERFYYLYALINENSQVYIGSTHNLIHRITQHNKNYGAVATKNKGPWFLFAVQCFASEEDARNAEVNTKRDFTSFLRQTRLSIETVLSERGVFENTNISLL